MCINPVFIKRKMNKNFLKAANDRTSLNFFENMMNKFEEAFQ